MEEKFNLTIRTPMEEVYNGEADSISLAGEGGEVQVFANHASLTATLSFTPAVITNGNTEEHYLVRNGVFLFDNMENSAVLLALSCEQKSEINKQTVKEYAAFIEKQLKEGKDLSDLQLLYLKGEQVAVEQQLEEISE